MRVEQLTWQTWSEICDVLHDIVGAKISGHQLPDGSIALINQESREVIAREGDWIIRMAP